MNRPPGLSAYATPLASERKTPDELPEHGVSPAPPTVAMEPNPPMYSPPTEVATDAGLARAAPLFAGADRKSRLKRLCQRL